MKITKIEVIPVEIPLHVTYETAEGTMPAQRAIVKIHTEEGIVGLGESMPFVWYKEPVETVVINIRKYFSPVLIGSDPFDIETNMGKMDKVMPGQPSSKNAVATALYDIMGKALNVPIYKLIGGYCNEKMPATGSIGFGTPEKVAAEALQWTERGVKAFKIKIGRDGKHGSEEDVKAVEAIRKAVGDNISLRVDANETYATRVGILRQMEEYDLDLIEQPAPARDLDGMRRIAEALDTPVLADQSIFGLYDAADVIKKNAADVIMVKNYVVGGFYRTKQLLGLLKSMHVANYIEGGSETGVGTAATLQLAASISQVDYWGCLNGPLLLSEDLIQEPLEFNNGCWTVPTKPGLGVELDEEKLRSLTIK